MCPHVKECMSSCEGGVYVSSCEAGVCMCLRVWLVLGLKM